MELEDEEERWRREPKMPRRPEYIQYGRAELQYRTIQNTVPYHLPPGFLASTGQSRRLEHLLKFPLIQSRHETLAYSSLLPA